MTRAWFVEPTILGGNVEVAERSKLGLGRRPGDIRIERQGFSFCFPITTGHLISAVLSLLLWLFRK